MTRTSFFPSFFTSGPYSLCPVTKLNLGRTTKRDGTVQIGKHVFVTSEQVELLKELDSEGYNVYLQTIPTAPKIPLSKAL